VAPAVAGAVGIAAGIGKRGGHGLCQRVLVPRIGTSRAAWSLGKRRMALIPNSKANEQSQGLFIGITPIWR
jgi:hypothetical protein